MQTTPLTEAAIGWLEKRGHQRRNRRPIWRVERRTY